MAMDSLLSTTRSNDVRSIFSQDSAASTAPSSVSSEGSSYHAINLALLNVETADWYMSLIQLVLEVLHEDQEILDEIMNRHSWLMDEDATSETFEDAAASYESPRVSEIEYASNQGWGSPNHTVDDVFTIRSSDYFGDVETVHSLVELGGLLKRMHGPAASIGGSSTSDKLRSQNPLVDRPRLRQARLDDYWDEMVRQKLSKRSNFDQTPLVGQAHLTTLDTPRTQLHNNNPAGLNQNQQHFQKKPSTMQKICSTLDMLFCGFPRLSTRARCLLPRPKPVSERIQLLSLGKSRIQYGTEIKRSVKKRAIRGIRGKYAAS